MKRSARSAFAARKQANEAAPDVVKGKDVETSGGDDVEGASVDGVSDEEIEFANAFEALTNTKASEPSPRKKLKNKADWSTIHGKPTTCDQNRIFHLDEDTIKIELLPDEIVSVCGSFLLSVQKGSVSILGAKLTDVTPDQYYPVHAPLSHPLPVITSLKPKKTKLQLSVILLKNFNSGLQQISNICPSYDSLFKTPSASSLLSPKDPTFHVILRTESPLAQIAYPVSWREAFLTISAASSPKVLICGSKGMGKSTLAHYLTNSFVRRTPVNYLDTDPGQPAFSPPGMVSLHRVQEPILGPAFASRGMAEINRCHHIGNITPRDNPRYYISCIEDLLSQDTQDAPTIINTPGWAKGTGLELIISLIEIAKPNFIIILSVPGNETLAQALHPVAQDCQSHMLIIEPAINISPMVQLTAADHRTLGIMSYFHGLGYDQWDFHTHLTAWKPWVVKYSGPPSERGLLAIAIQGEELLSEDILLAVNGTIVAIVLTTRIEGYIQNTPEGVPVIVGREAPFMNPREVRCVGYALVRAVDNRNEQLLLLSPWNPSSIGDGESVVLERGRVNMPVWGLWSHKKSRALGPWLQRQ